MLLYSEFLCSYPPMRKSGTTPITCPFILTGIPRDHPESYHSFMYKHLFQHIDIQAQNVHLLDGNAPDLMEECRRYEQKITEAGGIDLFMGGEL